MSNFNTKTLGTEVKRSKFIDISDRKEEITKVGLDWQNRKQGTPGLYEMNSQGMSFVVGLLGELVYARLVGLEPELNLEYKPYGDIGEDFRNSVDVKTVTKATNRYTIENKEVQDEKSLKPIEKWAKYYAKVLLNEEQTGGWVLGWTTKTILLNGAIKDFGYGPRYTVHDSDLFSFTTEINYIWNIHNKSLSLPEGELKDYLHSRYQKDYIDYHKEYQRQVKAGLI